MNNPDSKFAEIVTESFGVNVQEVIQQKDYLSFKPLEPLDPVAPQTIDPDAGAGVEEEDVVKNDESVDAGDAGKEDYQE